MNMQNGRHAERRLSPIILSGALLALGTLGAKPPSALADAPPQSSTAKAVGAANAFLATLDEKQRATVLFQFTDDKQRANWTNFPAGFIPRGGLSMKVLNEAQTKATMNVVAAVLSSQGYEKVQQIMQADEVLKSHANNGPGGGRGGPRDGGPGGNDRGPRDGGRRGGGPPGGNGGAMFGKDLYSISILGTPSEKEPWMVQFGGHHLALNITIVGEQGILMPSLTGAQPATFKENGKTIRPLGQENDKGFALLNALDVSQRKEAVLPYGVNDLMLGPGRDGRIIQPEGLKVSAMNDKQRAMLVDLIAQWAGIVADSYASARMDEIKAGLSDTYFAWSGPTTVEPGKNGSAYYRIQGPKLVIEYAPQRGEDHVHTIYRDPTNDYGRAAVAKPEALHK